MLAERREISIGLLSCLLQAVRFLSQIAVEVLNKIPGFVKTGQTGFYCRQVLRRLNHLGQAHPGGVVLFVPHIYHQRMNGFGQTIAEI